MADICRRHGQPVLATKTKNGKRTDICQVCLYDPLKPRTNRNRTEEDSILKKLGLIK